MTAPTAVGLEYVCPRCRGPVTSTPAAYDCAPCGASYPVVAGIPDFRVAPDPWIGLEDDRAKALRVADLTRDLSFEQSARAYWEITPETPVALAERFVEHVVGAPRRSREWLEGLRSPGPHGTWLDLGCGTGDLLVALLTRGQHGVGIDIALRWLVVARRRPELRNAPLVCCCAEALPFRDASFAHAAALGLLEHTTHPEPVLREARRVLSPGGTFAGRTVNRYSPLPEPHVGVWGVGLVPRRWANRYVSWRSGQPYLHHRPSSPRELRRDLGRAGFRHPRVRPARLLPTEATSLGRLARRALGPYEFVRRTPVATRLLTWIAPVLDVEGTAP